MANFANLLFVILLVFVLYSRVLTFLSPIQRFLISLTIGVHLFFLFTSISYFLSLNYSISSFASDYTEVFFLSVLCLYALIALLYFSKNAALSSVQSASDNEGKPLPAGSFLIDFEFITSSKAKHNALMMFTVFCFLCVLAYCLSEFHMQPHGEWDAWAIWNLKARFLFRNPEQWFDGFSQVINWTHPDYPLFLPALVAKLWTMVNGESVLVPHIVALFYLFSATVIVFCMVNHFSHSTMAAIAVLVLLSSYAYIKTSVLLTADMPLATLLLLSVCFFISYLQIKNTALLWLAFLFLSATFWMKNEGQLIFLVFSIFYVLKSWRIGELTITLKVAMVAVIPSAIALWVFKNNVSLANDLFEHNSIDAIILRFTELERYKLVLISFFDSMIDIFKLSIVFVVYLLFRYRRMIVGTAVTYLFCAIVIAISGYLAIYLFITPHDLPWHLQTSMKRILIHFYPAFVFLLLVLPVQSHERSTNNL